MNPRLNELEGLINELSERLSNIETDTDFNDPEQAALVNTMLDELEGYICELENMLLTLQ